MTSGVVSAWSLTTSPKRSEIALAVIFTIQVVSGLAITDTVSWLWLGGGFVAFAVAVGPGATSGVGQRVGAWFRAFGLAWRIAVIVAFALVAGGAVTWSALRPLVYSFALGGVAAISSIVFLRVIGSYGSDASPERA